MPLVDFVVGGAQKSGTTALFHYLRQHPSVGVGRSKELHFFDRDWHFHSAQVNYDPLHARFEHESLQKTAGDFTPIYLFDPKVAGRIHVYNPNMKFIFLLRDPVARAYSQWVMEHEKGKETRGFVAALIHELKSRRRQPYHPVRSFLARGIYSQQLRRYFDLFPKNNILTLRHNDLLASPRSTLLRIYEFLEIEPGPLPAPLIAHARNYLPINRWVDRLLRAYYAVETRRVRKLLGWKKWPGA